MKKLNPLTKEEHIKLAQDLLKSQEILKVWLERLWKANGVKCKEAKLLHQVLNILSLKLYNELDEQWYKINSEHNSPYYESGKTAYI
jgi:hypothetical protein